MEQHMVRKNDEGGMKRFRVIWIAICVILSVVLVLGVVAIVLDQKGALGDPGARTPLILAAVVAVFAPVTLFFVFFAGSMVIKHLPLIRLVMKDLT